jgi:hypothetical protein
LDLGWGVFLQGNAASPYSAARDKAQRKSGAISGFQNAKPTIFTLLGLPAGKMGEALSAGYPGRVGGCFNFPSLMQFHLLPLAAVLALGLSSCDKKEMPAASPAGAAPVLPRPEAPMMDSKVIFMKALEVLTAEVNAMSRDKTANPIGMMKKIPAMMAKLESVPLKGLPEDLAAAFTRLSKNANATGALISAIPAGLPSDPAAIRPYMQAHPEIMEIMKELESKLAPLNTEAEAAGKALEMVAAKHGLDVNPFIKAVRQLGAGAG